MVRPLLLIPAAPPRAICLSSQGDGKPLALIPGLDLLNDGGSSASAMVRHSTDGNGAFELVAKRDHVVGEPLTIDYGMRPSHRLLRMYGFIHSAGEDGEVDECAEAGEELMLPLLPRASELTHASESEMEEIEAARAALSRIGVQGSSIRLTLGANGQVELPRLSASDAETATALRVLGGAAEAQLRRQNEGKAACEAVSRLGGEGGTEAGARARARLCLRLHAREAGVLAAALPQLRPVG